MATDLKLLGKLLALTRSAEGEEALRAEEVFTNLFFKWCDEQGLREDVGFARIGDASDVGKLFLDSIAGHTEARVLQLNAFDLCVVGTLPTCRALAWWFENALPEIVETSQKSAYAEREFFQLGACHGLRDELLSKRPPVVMKAAPTAAVAPAPTEAADGAAPVDAPPAPSEAPKMPNLKEQTAIRAGHLFGRKLVQRTTARCPYPLR